MEQQYRGKLSGLGLPLQGGQIRPQPTTAKFNFLDLSGLSCIAFKLIGTLIEIEKSPLYNPNWLEYFVAGCRGRVLH